MMNNLSHELRTPIAAIHAALGLLQSGKVHPHSARGQRLLSIASDNTQRLLRVTTALEGSASSTDARLQVVDLERLRLEADLYAAWERGKFAVFYQPIVCTRSQRIIALEALLRWHHPRRGWVSPTVFIPLAEELGLIAALGDWVLGQACQQLQVWQAQFPSPQPLAVSVNLSPLQLGQPQLVQTIRDLLQQTNLAHGSLHLEITESAPLENSAVAIEGLQQLKSLGIFLYLDDFGTGYSSLWRLPELAIDVLKVDRVFVARQQWSLIRGIFHLAASLGIKVVVEGIETAAELAQIQSQGCYCYQGYHFSPPVEAAEATRLLQHHNEALRGVQPVAVNC